MGPTEIGGPDPSDESVASEESTPPDSIAWLSSHDMYFSFSFSFSFSLVSSHIVPSGPEGLVGDRESKTLPPLIASRFSGSNQSKELTMIPLALERALEFVAIVDAKRRFGSKNGGGRLDTGRGVKPGTLPSLEVMSSLVGSVTRAGR